jgi:hypothetical protein
MHIRQLSSSLAFVALMASAAVAQSPAAVSSAQEKKQAAPSDAKKAGGSMVGCVDEQDGHYVLVEDRTLAPVANLEADGFPTEGFAKHMGHKVTIRGVSTPGSGRPTFKVRAIEPISDSCTPQRP